METIFGRDAAERKGTSEDNKNTNEPIKRYPLSERGNNIAFKCNYCDGNELNEGIGFLGLCSDRNIRYNIIKEPKTRCSSPDCPCYKYYKGEMGRASLRNQYETDEFICNECNILIKWKASAGTVQNGSRAGTPLKISRVEENSLCVLTTRFPKSTEQERVIFGLFLVGEIFCGDESNPGYVRADSKHRLTFTAQEAEKMLFWYYYANRTFSRKPFWGTGLFRYFDDEIAIQILRDAVTIKRGKADFKTAQDIFNCFVCERQPIVAGSPDGALMRI